MTFVSRPRRDPLGTNCWWVKWDGGAVRIDTSRADAEAYAEERNTDGRTYVAIIPARKEHECQLSLL